MEIVLIVLVVIFIVGFFVGLSGKTDNSVSEAGKTGLGCVIMAIILGVLFLIVGKACSNYNDPDSGINRQIRDGYNLYD